LYVKLPPQAEDWATPDRFEVLGPSGPQAVSVFGEAETLVMVGADSDTVTVAVAVTGATAAGGGGCTQQRSGNFFGRIIGAGAGVVSVTVT
jgi:hypothetical protein